jgi:hypothetical protein
LRGRNLRIAGGDVRDTPGTFAGGLLRTLDSHASLVPRVALSQVVAAVRTIEAKEGVATATTGSGRTIRHAAAHAYDATL